jgi:hypothetical protein
LSSDNDNGSTSAAESPLKKTTKRDTKTPKANKGEGRKGRNTGHNLDQGGKRHELTEKTASQQRALNTASSSVASQEINECSKKMSIMIERMERLEEKLFEIDRKIDSIGWVEGRHIHASSSPANKRAHTALTPVSPSPVIDDDMSLSLTDLYIHVCTELCDRNSRLRVSTRFMYLSIGYVMYLIYLWLWNILIYTQVELYVCTNVCKTI